MGCSPSFFCRTSSISFLFIESIRRSRSRLLSVPIMSLGYPVASSIKSMMVCLMNSGELGVKAGSGEGSSGGWAAESKLAPVLPGGSTLFLKAVALPLMGAVPARNLSIDW